MLPQEIKDNLLELVAHTDHAEELAVDVMVAVQEHYGYLTDEAVQEVADMLAMSTVEVEGLATFYNFIYREPVGKYVIHICDSAPCWLAGYQTLLEYLQHKLQIELGQTTKDGLFTLLPVCCIGYCDRAPAMLINRKVYGHLTPEKIDEILHDLKVRTTSS